MSREKALGIALGNINPITGEALADFSPRKTKVMGIGDISESYLYFSRVKMFSNLLLPG